jgi:hypothetical protein
MSGPYCKTCNYYRKMTFGDDGECNDPTKIISIGKVDDVNTAPYVREDWECKNHTQLFHGKQICDKCIHNHMCMVLESMMSQFNVSKNELDKIGCNRFEDGEPQK